MATNDYLDEVFSHFNYTVVAMFSEYLNDVEQHSYLELTDDWWLNLFNKLDIINKMTDCDTSDTESEILNNVIAEFPANFLTADQITEVKNNLKEAYLEFIQLVLI